MWSSVEWGQLVTFYDPDTSRLTPTMKKLDDVHYGSSYASPYKINGDKLVWAVFEADAD